MKVTSELNPPTDCSLILKDLDSPGNNIKFFSADVIAKSPIEVEGRGSGFRVIETKSNPIPTAITIPKTPMSINFFNGLRLNGFAIYKSIVDVYIVKV